MYFFFNSVLPKQKSYNNPVVVNLLIYQVVNPRVTCGFNCFLPAVKIKNIMTHIISEVPNRICLPLVGILLDNLFIFFANFPGIQTYEKQVSFRLRKFFVLARLGPREGKSRTTLAVLIPPLFWLWVP